MGGYKQPPNGKNGGFDSGVLKHTKVLSLKLAPCVLLNFGCGDPEKNVIRDDIGNSFGESRGWGISVVSVVFKISQVTIHLGKNCAKVLHDVRSGTVDPAIRTDKGSCLSTVRGYLKTRCL